MGMKREGYLQSFSAWHPEAGDIGRGAELNTEQGVAFGSLFLTKVLDIHEKREISADEALFIENTAQESSSIIRYLLEQKEYIPPRDPLLIDNLLSRAVDFLSVTDPSVLEPEDWPEPDVESVVRATALVAGTAFSIARTPRIRVLAEEYAIAATHCLTTMLRDNQGAEVDPYMLEKMQNMVVSYESADKK